MRTRFALPIAGTALILAACSGAEDGTDGIDLGADDQPDQTAAEIDDDPDPDSDPGVDVEELDGPDDADDTTDQDGQDDATAEQEAETDADSATADDGATDDAAADGLVDLTEAIPGTWPVGDAGTVTFSLADGALGLDDVTTNDGWRSDIDEQDPDEIEVDFRQDNVEWEIEIELEDNGAVLEIEIDQDIQDAATGSYDIGDAGSFVFSVQDGQLVLDDLDLADGWTLVETEEEADEIDFEISNGPREFDVDIELESDGTIDIEIDYGVVGPVNG